ncbi:MAG: hypothetical protein U9Q84_06575 [Thermodesulfobacteriota bacterium]|nr:hypothetical protein [Thermodesulfobacteriota bacterium]
MSENSSTIKEIIFASAIIILLISVALAVFCESLVQKFYPEFSSILYLSSIIFFGGLGCAILNRRPVIGFLAVFITILIPFMHKWLIGYWDWLRQYFHGFS